jgi:hypothetical protein
LETFTEPKRLVENPGYREQRLASLAGLSTETIDKPIRALIAAFNRLSCCFSLQSCYGHFLCEGRRDPQNLKPLPGAEPDSGVVEYRIAFIAFCVDNNDHGRRFLAASRRIPEIDPDNIQFGCAEWFWERQPNSYVLQVEPDRFKSEDKAMLDYREALDLEKARNAFFVQLGKLMEDRGAYRQRRPLCQSA